MKPDKNNKLLIVFLSIGLVFVEYFSLFFTHCLLQDGANYLSALIDALQKVFEFAPPFGVFREDLALTLQNMLLFLAIYALATVWIVIEQQRKAHFKGKTECGSTKWMTNLREYNKQYTDPVDSTKNDGQNNLILTDDVFLNMDTRVTRLNNNITVVGGSGAGKSRFFVKPNLLQANTNYVITDPSGELLESTGKFLEQEGYTIKVFNLVEMAKSNCYNPFDYIRDDLGVVMMIKCLIKNTTPAGQRGGDPFWEKSEEALLQAISFYLIEARPKKDRNFSTVMKLLRCAEVNEQDPSAESELDKLFKQHEKENPTSLAVKQYKIFKMGAGKTLKSILISCSVRLTVFNLEQIASLTRSDTENGVELEKMGEGKRALFVIIPSADSTYNFLVSMMYSQLFETLYFIAETRMTGKRLESPVRFLLDEFANIGEIPEFTKKLATMRKYDISCSIILQNLAQIKTMYKDDWQTILGNCDSFLFLGGQEYETVEYVSKELGCATITVKDHSMSFGKGRNSGTSYKQTKRELMTPDELMRLKNSDCVLLIRGLYPFKSKKFRYQRHKNYKYTADANKALKYELKILNQVAMSQEEIDAVRERFFAKATVSNKREQLISQPKPLEVALKDAGVQNGSVVSVLPPMEINEANRKSTHDAVFSDTITGLKDKSETWSKTVPTDGSSECVFNKTDTQTDLSKQNNRVENKKETAEEDSDSILTKEDGNFISINKENENMDEWEV